MPRMRRTGRPGLLGTVARTAVITSTAGAVADKRRLRAQQYAPAHAPAATAAQPAPAPAAPAADDLTAQLERLGELHSSGVLTADEFGAAKARLLG